jgi:hypothetical protein
MDFRDYFAGNLRPGSELAPGCYGIPVPSLFESASQGKV